MSTAKNNPKREHPFAGLIRLGEMPLIIAGMAGIVFKLLNLPAASLLLILALGTLAMLYVLSAMAPTGDGTLSNADKMVLKMNGIGSAMGVIGILFILKLWPGSRVMILMSSGLLLATAFYMINANSKVVESKPFVSRTIYRTIGIALLEIMLFLVPQQH